MKKHLSLLVKIIIITVLAVFIITYAYNLTENYKNVPTQDYSIEQDQNQKKLNQIVDNEKARTDAAWQRLMDSINRIN